MHIEIDTDSGPRGVVAVDGREPRPFDGWLGLLAELGEVFSFDVRSLGQHPEGDVEGGTQG